MTIASGLGRYLAALFDDAPQAAFAEIRYRVGDEMHRAFYGASDLDALASGIAAVSANTDVYIGVLPRRRRGGTRNDVLSQARLVWADCDTPASVAALRAFAPRPSLAVASSMDNRHGYWLLSSPVSLHAIEAANRRLAGLLGADPQCIDAARVMRVVSSFNTKYHPPVPVRLLHCDLSARYDLAEVVGAISDDAAMTPSPDAARPLRRTDALLHIEPRFYVETLTGIEVPRNGKIPCPFHHPDRTPSLHVFDEPERGWFCFGCGRGGSIYDFAASLWLPGQSPHAGNLRGSDFIAVRNRLKVTLGM